MAWFRASEASARDEREGIAMKRKSILMAAAVLLCLSLTAAGCRTAPQQAGAPQSSAPESSEPEKSSTPESEPEESSIPESEPEAGDAPGTVDREPDEMLTPVEGLRWGMTKEEAIEALGSPAYEETQDEDFVNLLLEGSFPTGYGADVSRVTLRFYAQDYGIPGYDGLVEATAICEAENVEALCESLGETYGSLRKTDGSTSPSRWETEAMYQLENAEELEEKLTAAFTEALGSGDIAGMMVTPSMGAPGVSLEVYTQGDAAGLVTANGRYLVLREAVSAVELGGEG